ncbi:MAG TPA: EAL domain-containing protein [Actinomycetota bacterium]|nr:EAL domain-containing protein [Actinomycetota bacterium]
MNRRSLWLIYLIVGGLASIANFTVSAGSNYQRFGFDLISMSAVVAIVVGVRIHRPTRARIWYGFALGQAMWVVGDSIFSYYATFLHRALPFPSIADVLYIGAYPVFILVLLSLVRSRQGGKDIRSLMDATIIATGLGLLSWVFLTKPLLNDDSLNLLQRTTSVLLPVMDILVLALIARLLVVLGARPRSFILLGSLTASFTAFTLHALTAFDGSSQLNTGVFIAWLASLLLWGAVSLHPSMVRLTDGATAMHARRFGSWRLVLLTAAALVAPTVLVVQTLLDQAVDDLVAVASALLFLLVMARMAGLIRDARAAVTELDAQSNRLRRGIEARADLEHQLRDQALHDPLTGLPNRAMFTERLGQALLAPTHIHESVAMLFLDLDEFQAVNDTFGHEAGDELLRQIVRRIRGYLRASHTLARVEGDEFAILLAEVNGLRDATSVADGLVEIMQLPFALQGDLITVNVSVGLALANDGDMAENVLRNANAAMYAAKLNGKNQRVIYTPDMHSIVKDRAELKKALENALTEGELRIAYQPIVDIQSGQVNGAEALVRWEHPERGLIPPFEFLPYAEESGLIVEIDRWVVMQACIQLAKWKEDLPNGSNMGISVNFSGRTIQDNHIVAWVKVCLNASGLEPRDVLIEITESALISNLDTAVRRMNELKRLGVRLAVDDFGTGYASLNYVKRFPLDFLKIDKAFVDGVTQGPEESALARAILGLAEALGLDTIAEGIEDAGQALELSRLGSRFGQGYLYSPPVSASSMVELVHAGFAHASGLSRIPAGLALSGNPVLSSSGAISRSAPPARR